MSNLLDTRHKPATTYQLAVGYFSCNCQLPAGRIALINSRITNGSWLAVAILSGGIFLRVVHLDSDPNYYEWVGYITDEGRWVQTPRNLVLHGLFPEGLGKLHLIMAPLFEAASFAVFYFFGVTILTARAFAAVCGSIFLVAF